jgi:hypothetical protein
MDRGVCIASIIDMDRVACIASIIDVDRVVCIASIMDMDRGVYMVSYKRQTDLKSLVAYFVPAVLSIILHTNKAIGELLFIKIRKVVKWENITNHVFPISSVGIFT